MSEVKNKAPFSFMQYLAWGIVVFTQIIVPRGASGGDWLAQLVGGLLAVYVFSWIPYFIVSRIVFFLKKDTDRDKFKMIWLHLFMILFGLMVAAGRFVG